MMPNNNQQVFIELVRAGLWDAAVRLAPFGNVNYDALLQLAIEQSVVGLVAAGLERVVDIKPSQQDVIKFLGHTLLLEQRNKSMNAFIAGLIERLRKVGIYTLLVKGQGIAQCYERPLWRASGDVDLLLSKDNYDKAKLYLAPMASSITEEDASRKHLSMTINTWVVELHGTLNGGVSKYIDRGLDNILGDLFCGGNVRSWMDGSTQVFMPNPDNDAIIIFAHILQHFFYGGIGLRQVCDWCRLLKTYREELDHRQLEARLREMHLMSEWRVFASLAVIFLGFPKDIMPLYSAENRWEIKASRVFALIIETGNFGQRRDMSYKKNNLFLIRLVISFLRHTKDAYRQFVIFPDKSLRVWLKMIGQGLRFAVKGEG